MDLASDDLKQQRAARMRSARAADERLIEAIFGDVLFGRLPQSDRSADVLAARDPAGATVTLPILTKGL